MSERHKDDPPGPITANEWFLSAEAKAQHEWERKQAAKAKRKRPLSQPIAKDRSCD